MDGMYAQTMELAAELWLQDIAEVLTTGRALIPVDGRLSDEEYAIQIQAREMWESLANLEDLNYAQNMGNAQAPGGSREDTTELAAHYGRRAEEIRELLFQNDMFEAPIYLGQANTDTESDPQV